MSREYSYRTAQKLLWIALGVAGVFMTVLVFGGCLYNYFFEDGEIISVLILGLITMVMVPTSFLATYIALKTRLLINREGLELKSPTVLLTVGWDDMKIVQARDRMGKYLAVYSAEMEVQKIGLGHYIPGTAHKDTMMKGVPISRFLGDDMQEIIRLLISFRDM